MIVHKTIVPTVSTISEFKNSLPLPLYKLKYLPYHLVLNTYYN